MAEELANEETKPVDRWVIYTRDEGYNGHHPGLGVRFMDGQATTENAELAAEAKKHAAFTVRKVKAPEIKAETKK